MAHSLNVWWMNLPNGMFHGEFRAADMFGFDGLVWKVHFSK
jgi:hypothetical protein